MFPTWSIWDERPLAYLLSGICWHFRTPRQCSGVAFEVHLETNIVEVTLARGRQGRLAMINPRKRLSFGFIIGRYLHPRSFFHLAPEKWCWNKDLCLSFWGPGNFSGGRTVSFLGRVFFGRESLLCVSCFSMAWRWDIRFDWVRLRVEPPKLRVFPVFRFSDSVEAAKNEPCSAFMRTPVAWFRNLAITTWDLRSVKTPVNNGRFSQPQLVN